MSKLIPFLFAGAGATVTSVGGVFMLRSGSKGAEGNSQGKKSQTEEIPAFDTLDKFKTGKGGECVASLFNSVELKNPTNVTDIASGKPSDTDYFGAASTSENEIQGCLIVDWKKDEYTVNNQKKFKGIFTGTWAFKNGTKGFINFNVAKTNNTNKQLDLTGGFYLLEKTGTTWEVKYKKEVENNKSIASSDFGTKFPKSKSDSEIHETGKDYWGFVEDANKANDVCDSTCTGAVTSTTRGNKKWHWNKTSASGNKKMKEWSDSLEGWKHMYGDEHFKLGDRLENFQGTGAVQNAQ